MFEEIIRKTNSLANERPLIGILLFFTVVISMALLIGVAIVISPAYFFLFLPLGIFMIITIISIFAYREKRKLETLFREDMKKIEELEKKIGGKKK